MSKWSSLNFDAKEPATFSGWYIGAWLLVGILVAVVFAVSRGSTKPPSALPSKAELTVVSHVVSDDPGDFVEEDAVVSAKEDAVVSAKFVPVNRLWSSDEASDMEQPMLDTESGYGFSDFQSAFAHARETPVMDGPKRRGAVSADLQQFIDTHDVPDALLEWAAAPEVPEAVSPTAAMSEDAMMLAREALQTVPNASADVVASALREILSARTEAARSGIELPGVPDEQATTLRYWASKQGPVALLAKSILSR